MNPDPIISDLLSADTQRRSKAWDSMLRTLIPRIERRVTRRLRHAPPHVRQEMEDISTAVMQKLVEKLGVGVPKMSVAGFALGIADNLCLQAVDLSRDKEKGRGGDSPDPLGQMTGYELTGSQTMLATGVRSAVRPGLLDFRSDLERAACKPHTGAAASSPVLQFHAIDLAMQGQGKPKHLKEATEIAAVDATRTRDRAIQVLSARIEPYLRPEAAVSSTATFELSWSQLEPGEIIPSLWCQLSIGCVAFDAPFQDAHPDHAARISAFQRSHRSHCPDCGSPFEEPPQATLQTWKDAAEGSLTRSGLV